VFLGNHVIPFGDICFKAIKRLSLTKVAKQKLHEHRTDAVQA